jgi:hypothetical protein
MNKHELKVKLEDSESAYLKVNSTVGNQSFTCQIKQKV